MLAIVGSLGVGATNAIFSDDEASTGNTFTAGAVDLTVDNESYYNGELNEGTTWLEARNLDDGAGPAGGEYLFFNFGDVKPGDWGEDTISLHVDDNDSWLCIDVTLTSDDDNGFTEPEESDGDTTDGVGEGELADAIDFMWWADDGDNVYEDDEDLLPAGPLGNLEVGETAVVALADSSGNIWDEEGPLPGDSVRFIGKAWCLGDMNSDPVAQDGEGKTGSNGPLDRGTGFTCDGSGVNNITQTDSMTADIVFYAEQARHNDEFLCSGEPQKRTGLITITKQVEGGSAVVEDFDLLVGTEPVVSGVQEEMISGDYVVSEVNNSGEFYEATFGGDCDSEGNVTIPADGSASCTVLNTVVQPGSITVDKSVSFSSTGFAVDVSDFDLFLDDGNGPFAVTDEVAATGLAPGTYTVSENYTGGESISFDAIFTLDCSDDGETGTVTLGAGESLTCDLENEVSPLPV